MQKENKCHDREGKNKNVVRNEKKKENRERKEEGRSLKKSREYMKKINKRWLIKNKEKTKSPSY